MFDKNLMKEAIDRRLLKSNKHPHHDLHLISYTKSTVAGHVWTNETLAGRSLVVDSDFNIVSPCLTKFFNDFEQAQELKEIGYDVYEKLDGSLITLFVHEDELIIRSKSVWQSELIDQVTHYVEMHELQQFIQEGYTYVCEWIHPLNRHVVDYGDRVSLVLLTVIANDDPSEQYAPEEIDWDGPILSRPKKVDLSDARDTAQLKERVPEGEEGWILWNRETNLRTKIKSHEYLQLHRVKFNLNPKYMLEIIKEGNMSKIDSMLENIIALDEQSAEMLQYIYHGMVSDINTLHQNIVKVYNDNRHIEDRGEFAKAVLAHRQPIAGGCFILKDGRELDDYIFRAVDLGKYNAIMNKEVACTGN